MNTLKKNLLIALITVIATTSALGLFAFKNKMPEGGKETAIVTAVGLSYVRTNIGSQEPEDINIKGGGSFAISNKSIALNTSFAKLYSLGYHMESSNGGDTYQYYVFVK